MRIPRCATSASRTERPRAACRPGPCAAGWPRTRAAGFAGLQPAPRRGTTPSAIPAAVLELASQLRREAPHRNVRQLIQVLEWEGHVAPGALKRSTLQEQLLARGYSARQFVSRSLLMGLPHFW